MVLAVGATGITAALVPAGTAAAANQTVTNCNDSGAGSLRQAVINAGSGDNIDFNFTVACSTITLTSGAIEINKSLTITGPGANMLAVSGDSTSQVFKVDAGVTVGISGLTIEDGKNTEGYCSYGCQASGGGIENAGTLTLTEDVVTENTSLGGCFQYCGAFGGGIENDATGTLTVTDSTVSDNTASGTCGPSDCSGMGGGIVNYGTLTITDSAVSDNNAYSGCDNNCGASGGGLENEPGATATVSDSNFDDNSALLGCTDQCGASGAGIDNGGTLTVADSHFSENSAGAYCDTQCAPMGGGIANEAGATMSLTTDVLTANSALTGCSSGCNPLGGGLYNDGSVTVESSTIIDSGQLGGDCYLAKPLVDLGGNVDDDGTCFLPHNGSLVAAVVEVETSPAYAGDSVEISSSQLQSACGR
ncbi:MAG TPA: hypothetical protein VMF60_10595, partial [Acidimicrobiales bacterium]|nr:hypothetical protein [Acidimicrobiales bacterium]